MNRSMILAGGVLLCVSTLGCSKRGLPQAARALSGVPLVVEAPPTPGRTVEHIHRLRNEGRYVELTALLEKDRGARVIDFLLAMDELLAANDAIQNALREKTPHSAAVRWDLGYLRNSQGLFSEDVQVVSERTEGPQAFVTVRVADAPVLETVPLRRIEGRWVYCPETEIGNVPQTLRVLATSLKRMARSLRRETMTEEQIQNEFRLCISPRLKDVQLAAAESDRR